MLSSFNFTSRHKMILGWVLVISMLGWNVFRMSRRLSDQPYDRFQGLLPGSRSSSVRATILTGLVTKLTSIRPCSPP